MKLGRDFYRRADTLTVARELLGKLLVVPARGGELVAGRVVEVEAYAGVEDRASHAHGGRRTARTETMYAPGGVAYVYLVYGLHHQFNVVTGAKGSPHAVLLRALEPVAGITLMRRRRAARDDRALLSGPGKLCQALGIDRTFDGEDLTGARVWLEDDGFRVEPASVAAGPRVGVAYAGADAQRPYRFWLKGSPFVSRIK